MGEYALLEEPDGGVCAKCAEMYHPGLPCNQDSEGYQDFALELYKKTVETIEEIVTMKDHTDKYKIELIRHKINELWAWL